MEDVYTSFFNLFIKPGSGDILSPEPGVVLDFFEKNELKLLTSQARGAHYLSRLDPENFQFILKRLDFCLRFAIIDNYSHKDTFQAFYLRMLNAGVQTQVMRTYESLSKQIDKYQSEQQKISNSIVTLEENGNKIKRSMKKSNIQSVTILGIFSAVVFTFSGGFALIGSAFSGLNKISYCNAFLLIALVMLLSLTLIDVVYLLLSYIDRINNIIMQEENQKEKLWENLKTKFCQHPLIACVNVALAIGIVLSMLQFGSISSIQNQRKDNEGFNPPTNNVVSIPSPTPIPTLTIVPKASLQPNQTPSDTPLFSMDTSTKIDMPSITPTSKPVENKTISTATP